MLQVNFETMDKKELNSISLTSIIEDINISYSSLFFDEVSILNILDVKEMFERELISKKDYNILLKEYKSKFGEMDLKSLNCIVYVETNSENTLKLFSNELDATQYATMKANEMIENFLGDVDISDYRIFDNIDNYVKYLEDHLC